MAKHLLSASLLAFAVALLGGCARGNPYVLVAQGTHSFGRGDYQLANIQYIRAAEAGRFEQWIAFNLGNVYYALGEPEAAEKEWTLASETGSVELRYRVLHNLGVHAFERGDYARAYEYFRNALEVHPAGIEAKVNLELSLARIDATAQAAGQASRPAEGTSGRTGEIARVLNYLRRIEVQTWRSSERVTGERSDRDW